MYEQLINNMCMEDTYISQVFEYYHSCYRAHDWCEQFVYESQRIPDELRGNAFVGLCDRTIGQIIPVTRDLVGGAVRGGLIHAGLITSTGGELFRGCIVFPELDNNGNVVSATGYRYGKRIRHWQPKVVSWQKPEPDDYLLAGMALAKEVVHAKAFH